MVKGELQVNGGDRFDYDGVVIIIGPSPELEVKGGGVVTINGGVMIAATQQWFDCGNNWNNCSPGGTPTAGALKRSPIELNFEGGGNVNFNQAKIQTAGLLLYQGGFGGLGTGGTGTPIKVWNTCNRNAETACP